MIVVVLGHRLESARIHPRLRARTESGLEAFEDEDASCLLFTGGRTNPTVDRTECGVMGEYAVRQGYDPDRIVLEPSSEDTIGNAFFTRALLDDLEFDVDEICLVTDDYHVRRAKYAFDHCFGEEVSVQTTHCVETDIDPHTPERRRKVRQTRRFFEPVAAGDVEAIRRRLHAEHDCYEFPETVRPISP